MRKKFISSSVIVVLLIVLVGYGAYTISRAKVFALPSGTDEQVKIIHDKWTPKASMNEGRVMLNTAVLNGKIYVIGGYEDNDTVKSVKEYDPVTNRWTEKANLNEERDGFKTVVFNDKIYVIGGSATHKNEEKPIKTIEEYDPITDKWTTKASINSNLVLKAIVLNEKIYIVEGFIPDDDSVLKIEEYDPVTNKIIKKAGMKNENYSSPEGTNIGILNGKIYAIGGYGNIDALNLVEEYDPVTNKWTEKAQMNEERVHSHTVVLNGKIYAIGGYGKDEIILKTVEEYDPITNKWNKKASMNDARVYSNAVIVDKKIYVIGGYGKDLSILKTVEEYIP